MLAFPQWHLFTAEYCTEPVTYFRSWNVMLAFPQWHLFTSEYCTESVTYFRSWIVMLAFSQWHLSTAEYCTEPVTYYSLMNCHAGLSTVTFIYSWILHWTCNLLFPHELSCWPSTVALIYSWILHWTCNLLYPHELSCWSFYSDTYLQLNTALNL